MADLKFQPISAQQVTEIMTWHYETPYEIYDMGPADDKTLPYFLDPQYAFHAITDQSDALLGFCSFGPDGQVPGGNYSLEVSTPLGLRKPKVSSKNRATMGGTAGDNAQPFNNFAADFDSVERDQSPDRNRRQVTYLSREIIDIGLGLRPDLTGQGKGALFVAAVLNFARQAFAPTIFRVTVANFNKRALRVWEKAGFQPGESFTSSYDGRLFVIMTRKA